MLTSILAVTLLSVLQSTHAYTPSSGCGKALGATIKQGGTGSSNTISLTSNGIARTFLLHVPTTYKVSSAQGLIFSFSGRGKTAANQEQLSEFSQPWFNPDMLAIYPQGVSNQWQGDPEATTNDIQFTLDMIAYMSNNYCIDTDAIYMAGKSNGGGFSGNIAACDPVLSTKIAAFASASGADYQAANADGSCPDASTIAIPCNPGRIPLPFLETHGTADDTIPYLGGPRRTKCLPTIPRFMQNWAAVDGYDPSVNVTSNLVYNGNTIPLTNVKKYTWGNGLLTHYWVRNMGHSWPSTVANLDSASPTYFNATPIMMEFFRRYTLKGSSNLMMAERV